MSRPTASRRTSSISMLSPKMILSFVFVGGSGFYAGLLMGAQTRASSTMAMDCSNDPERKTLMGRINQQTAKIRLLQNALKVAQQEGKPEADQPEDTEPRFPGQMSRFLQGMAAVDRDAFAQRFDVGVPLQASSKDNQHVLLLYSNEKAMPTSDPFKAAEAKSNTRIPLYDDIDLATENCDVLNLILAQENDPTQCFAMMGQYRSHHIPKFMRLPDSGKLDHRAPLKLVNRGAQSSGRLSVKVPKGEHTKDYWKLLSVYLSTLDAALAELKPLAQKAAINNTLVVMVSNHGQSELLMNFVCSSRARGFDISNVLVFATDKETRDLAHGLGLHAHFDEKNFGHIPKRAAGRYADQTFTKIMMAKVYCVQMTMMLGYDVLFQDLDVVWYKNPLEFFRDNSSMIYDFDMYFQDDGSRSMFYAPYSANTGLYFVRNNDRTRYFFNSLLLAGDLITSTHSHQIALVSLLSEHASLYNLKVKVLSRDTEEFPGGFTFHKRHAYMKDLFAGKVHPYLFHMSWTENKKNKQHFFRQMGNWYLEDKCIETTVEQIMKKEKTITRVGNSSGYLLKHCCSAEPLIECFFKDKPSIHQCKNGVILDEGKKSFW